MRWGAPLCSQQGALTVADTCGDVNGDAQVNSGDLGTLLSYFGCTGGDCTADLDGDGDTDQADLAWLLIYYGCGPGGMPCGPCEPLGTGTIDVVLSSVDNTDVGLGDDVLEPEFNGGVTHFTFDLIAIVDIDNDWTTQASSVELVGDDLTFFQHFLSVNTEPNSGLFEDYSALEFDSFFADPPALFDHSHPQFAIGPVWGPTSVDTIWFDSSRDADVAATTQRFTLVVPDDSGILPTVVTDDCTHEFPILARVTTDATSAATGGDYLHRDFVIVDIAHPLCPGDVDGDGSVNQTDLGLLLASYERHPDDPFFDRRADLDCDGDVDQQDLGHLLAAYESDC